MVRMSALAARGWRPAGQDWGVNERMMNVTWLGFCWRGEGGSPVCAFGSVMFFWWWAPANAGRGRRILAGMCVECAMCDAVSGWVTCWFYCVCEVIFFRVSIVCVEPCPTWYYSRQFWPNPDCQQDSTRRLIMHDNISHTHTCVSYIIWRVICVLSFLHRVTICLIFVVTMLTFLTWSNTWLYLIINGVLSLGRIRYVL